MSVTKALEAQSIRAVLIPHGARRFELPGRTVSVVVMDVENGCQQIVREQPEESPPHGVTGPSQSVKDGKSDSSAVDVHYNQDVPLTWTSFVLQTSATGALTQLGSPNSTVHFWLSNGDRVKISGLEPSGSIDASGQRATGTTDGQGNIKLTLEGIGALGETTSTLWGSDPSHNATKKVAITILPI